MFGKLKEKILFKLSKQLGMQPETAEELEKIMENAHIIQKEENGKVGLGTTVKIKYIDDDEIEEYKIVGSKEADPSNNKISNESP